MKTVIVASLLFMAFLVCYEKELFALSYALFGLSLALCVVAVYRGQKTTAAPDAGPTSEPSRKKNAG
jgi:hypothetical protein